MNEPVTRQRPSIDFDEFERAVRGPAQPQRPQADDPLAELARLVGAQHDPYGDVFAQESRRLPDNSRQADAGARRASLDFSAIEAGLRGTLPTHDIGPALEPAVYQHQQTYPAPAASGYAPLTQAGSGHAPADGYDPQDYAAQDQAWYNSAAEAPQAQAATPSRSRRPIYAMAAVIVAGVVGIGVAFAYKGVNSGPREIAMIKAAPGPTKIQPPADEAGDQPTRDASILDKAQQPAPTKLISREEQPIDLSQAVNSSPRDVGNGLMPLYNFGSPAGAAASVPVPQPPGAAADGSKPSDATGIAGDIEPIRVRTRSYRPDGTPIPNDQPPAAAMDQPAAPTPRASPAKTAAAKSTTPKSTTRIATTPKPIVTASRGDDNATDAPDTAIAVPKKVKTSKAAVKPPVKTADNPDEGANDAATAPAAASGGGGGFAVQLAAPGSEAEAKQTSSRLSQKFSSELSGHQLGFHKASINGKSVFRVRVGSLTREQATDMCEKLKSSGGTCFVAKN